MDALLLVYTSDKVLFCPSVEYEVAGKYFEFSFRSVLLYVACKSKFNKSCSAFVFNVVRSSAACEINADALIETSDSIHQKKHQIYFPSIQSKWNQHIIPSDDCLL